MVNNVPLSSPWIDPVVIRDSSQAVTHMLNTTSCNVASSDVGGGSVASSDPGFLMNQSDCVPVYKDAEDQTYTDGIFSADFATNPLKIRFYGPIKLGTGYFTARTEIHRPRSRQHHENRSTPRLERPGRFH